MNSNYNRKNHLDTSIQYGNIFFLKVNRLARNRKLGIIKYVPLKAPIKKHSPLGAIEVNLQERNGSISNPSHSS